MTATSGRVILVVASLAVALIAGEILVRAVGVAPDVAYLSRDQFQLSSNPLIGWEPIPDPASLAPTASAASAGDPSWNLSERNSLGYRDYEHAPGRLPGVYRVVVLGDSITKGLGILEKEKVFTAVLERKLGESGLRSEVLNFGVEGYNTRQEVETLEDKGLRYRPDLVVLAYSPNDHDWPAHHLYKELLAEEFGGERIPTARVNAWLSASALFRFIRFRVLGEWADGAGGVDERVQRMIDQVEGDTVAEALEKLAGLSSRHGFEVLVVVFPYLENLDDYAHMNRHEWVRAASSRHGFHHLDLLAMFAECIRHYGHTIAFDDVHPNTLGHNCAGLAIADYIARSVERR